MATLGMVTLVGATSGCWEFLHVALSGNPRPYGQTYIQNALS